jgi:alpha-tubulin suppressor-like RCC1 family protein
MAAGSAHTCGVQHDGTLWCWGDNFYGQLGDGGTTMQLSPEQIGGATTWTDITAGEDHTCGLQTDGTLWCWGFNGYGQLGDGTTTDEHQPVEVPLG